MSNFEDKLQSSASRLRKSDNKQLSVPRSPLAPQRTYWGWIATPVAAVIGVVLGLSLPLLVSQAEDTPLVVQVHDTLHIPHTITDTVYLTQTKVVERERVVWRDRKENNADALNPTDTPSHVPPATCTSVACDGINYAMLVSK